MPTESHSCVRVSTGATLLMPPGTYSDTGAPPMSTTPVCSADDHSGTPMNVEFAPSADHMIDCVLL